MKKNLLVAILFIAPLFFIVASLFFGRYPVSVQAVTETLWLNLTLQQGGISDINQSLIWDIRLPRAILGALVGGSLAISGAAFQGLFHNPLVSPGMLGVTSGAGFGAVLSIILFNSTAYVYLFAFAFGGLAVVLSYFTGKIYDSTTRITLVLGGVIISSIFAALISLVKFMADPYNQLPTIVFWLMGSLSSARYQAIVTAGIPMVTGIVGLLVMRWRINPLSMGDQEAKTLGIDVSVNKMIVILSATLATAGAVCVSGIIGWVGLIIPHVGRMLVGNDNRLLIPASLVLGACFLVTVDVVARNLIGSEIPLGILTALVGGPFFIYLLKRTKGRGW